MFGRNKADVALSMRDFNTMLANQRGRRTTTEIVEIFGRLRNGAAFEMIVQVSYNPEVEATPEMALVRSFGSQAGSFNALSIERGWIQAEWTYPRLWKKAVTC